MRVTPILQRGARSEFDAKWLSLDDIRLLPAIRHLHGHHLHNKTKQANR